MAPVITSHPSEESLSDSMLTSDMPLGEYLFLRILQANPRARSIFGIPGDFNLALLEHLYTESVASKVEFVGFCNELNAAYAADGYAKVIQNLCVLITTYGVGELSALNGIAGAFAEFAPVLHIVGTTSTRQMEQARNANSKNIVNIHHLVQNKNSLAPPNHDVYRSVVENFCVALESLDQNVESNLDKIDRVIASILHESRPGYLFIPSDIPDIKVPSARLSQPLDLSELRSSELLASVSSRILHKLYLAEKPSILGDTLVDRFGARASLDKFVDCMPQKFVKLFTTAMGRNVEESLPNYVGVYAGILSSGAEVVEALENDTDCLLVMGHLNNEVNSGRYTANYDKIAEVVEIHPDYILIDGEQVAVKDSASGKRAFSINDLLTRLEQDFDARKLVHNSPSVNNIPKRLPLEQFALRDEVSKETITQNKLIDFFNSYLRPNDIVLVETCSFLFAMSDVRFPSGVQFFSQNFYGSIGYALPATFGVSRAERDLGSKRRVILIQGDGSAQMTVQELSTYLRYDIQSPEIFLLNNEGYTVERIIKGPTRLYNDIQDRWKWRELFKVFGDTNEEKHETAAIDTVADLETLAGQKRSEKIKFLEVKLSKLDVPQRFRTLIGK